MQTKSKVLLLGASLVFAAAEANAADAISIGATAKAPLLDGRCDGDEWKTATKFELPAQAAIYLMHDDDSLFICGKGKAEDYAVIDVYIEHAETGQLHKFHLSAQMGEHIYSGGEWGETERWKLTDWTGFWVPYFGFEETEDGRRPKFLRGSHREVQILRKKFPGDEWTMMFGLSAINNEDGSGGEFRYPENAVDNDKSTWQEFSFSN